MAKSRANIATKKKHILLKISLALVILLALLTTATYTWFEISKTPAVSDMTIVVNATRGIELSWDADDMASWSQHLDFSDVSPGQITELKPITYSYGEDCFYAARFGNDGRISGISDRLDDKKNANRSDWQGYYVKCTFFIRTDEDARISLLDAKQNTGTYVIGTPVWDNENIVHVDGGAGAQYAVRIGFRITPLGGKDDTEEKESRFVIYEPNCVNHVNYKGDYVSEYIETPGFGNSGLLIPKKDLIRQTSTLWTDLDTVEKDLVEYKYGAFLDDTTLLHMKKGEEAQIDVYLWLEGQDPDCTNLIGREAMIFSSIQLFADIDYDSGMDEIED